MAQGQLGDKGRGKLFCKVALVFLALDPRTKRPQVNKNQAKVCVCCCCCCDNDDNNSDNATHHGSKYLHASVSSSVK